MLSYTVTDYLRVQFHLGALAQPFMSFVLFCFNVNLKEVVCHVLPCIKKQHSPQHTCFDYYISVKEKQKRYNKIKLIFTLKNKLLNRLICFSLNCKSASETNVGCV